MVEDTPHDLVHDIAAQAVFGGHPLGRPVIGRAEVISTVSRRALAAYHRRAYSGRAHRARRGGEREARAARRAARGAQERRGRRESGCPRASRSRRLPPPGLRFQRKDTEQYHVCLSAPGIARLDERRFAASLLDAIVGGSASSRLFQEIREKRGMAYSVYSYSSQYADAGQIGLYVGTREENLGVVPRDRGRRARRPRGRERPARGAGAREGEPQGPAAALARVDVEPDDAAREGARDRHAAARDRRGRAPARGA